MHASCQCGNLTAEVADGAEPTVIMCHCIDCQRRSGSQFGSIAYYSAESVAVAGEAREFARGTDTGSTFTTGFCPICGSTVYAKASRLPEITGVTVGAIADPSFPPPLRSVYEQSKHHWIELPPGMTHHPRNKDT
jgi:hypothetical protein